MRNKKWENNHRQRNWKELQETFAKYKNIQQYKGNEPQDFYDIYFTKKPNLYFFKVNILLKTTLRQSLGFCKLWL